MASLRTALTTATAIESLANSTVADQVPHGAADAYTVPGRSRGCLLVQSALACGDDAASVQRELARRRQAEISEKTGTTPRLVRA